MKKDEVGTRDLCRFLSAQGPVTTAITAELAAGAKRSHWMWFVFPQIAGLGSSPMARRYAITSLAEARAYLAHPELGPRLIACTRLVLAHAGRRLEDIFGDVDALKFRSSMTLFEAAGEDPVFAEALETFCGGVRDAATLRSL